VKNAPAQTAVKATAPVPNAITTSNATKAMARVAARKNNGTCH
jgi:hypothetical protein